MRHVFVADDIAQLVYDWWIDGTGRDGSPGGEVPSWLTVIPEARDSLWSVDLFRCESILLKSDWVMLVMHVFTRGIVGFGVKRADIDGVAVCRMFNHARCSQRAPETLEC